MTKCWKSVRGFAKRATGSGRSVRLAAKAILTSKWATGFVFRAHQTAQEKRRSSGTSRMMRYLFQPSRVREMAATDWIPSPRSSSGLRRKLHCEELLARDTLALPTLQFGSGRGDELKWEKMELMAAGSCLLEFQSFPSTTLPPLQLHRRDAATIECNDQP